MSNVARNLQPPYNFCTKYMIPLEFLCKISDPPRNNQTPPVRFIELPLMSAPSGKLYEWLCHRKEKKGKKWRGNMLAQYARKLYLGMCMS